ncbi:holo-ACP synthase [Luteithermobacter gelatinilyticus]|uniref:holo-ACP synthase n=1 Tax=Luteithermobacter gelatinilyticus TaxID=2582913 RepID=UPI001105D462|nr:holo-ACP synthase [Luteithermobacter gelatinilyticus]|tara:strand:- start:2638 stop:3054 length:417 start_codon:yes stop_codon:yes gene_type:complete
MRVIGLGNDLVDIRRIENSLQRFGARFIHRIFTETEIARSEARELTRAASYAKRFAAKEAAAKALGTGFYQNGVVWKDVTVENDELGRPYLKLGGMARQRLEELVPNGYTAEVTLTMTDDYPWAQAIVLITAYPAGSA